MDNTLFSKLMASLSSNNCAVIENEKKWSYGDFLQYVVFAKNYFVSNGISRVMLLLPQGFFAYVLIWGAYLAKTTFCSVNVKNPPERNGYFAKLFDPDIIIADAQLSNIKDEFAFVSPITFFSGIEKTKLGDFQNDTDTDSDSVAYVMFTSGSTGLPKGVMVGRKGLDNFLTYCVNAWGITNNDVFGQYSNLSFDLSVADVFISIICGAAIVPFASDSEKLMPGRVIEKKTITFLHSVPSVIDLLDRAKNLNHNTLSSLRCVSFCGERLFQSHLDKLFQAKHDLIVFNTYGPTEATIFCSLQKLTAVDYMAYSDKTISIGEAIDGMTIEICLADKNGNGELYISGDNVALGYLDDISDCAFSEEVRDGISIRKYRTGDFVYRKDGSLYFAGRKDNQIKRLGHRIDLSEVDYWIREYGCPAVATVVIREKIISFVENDINQVGQILDYLKTKLPEYYIPQRIVPMQKMPLNGSGKIDTAKLAEEFLI